MSNSTQFSVGVLFVVGIVLVDGYLIVETDAEPSNMVWIEAGSFTMGSDRGMPDEYPAHPVDVSGFWIDKFEVSNQDFQSFVAETGYVTFSETIEDSLVFKSPEDNHNMRLGPLDWWNLVERADWRHPQGPDDNIEGKLKHPVVHVTYDDALAYCNWVGKILPTEAQFEFAARGGKEGEVYTWGNEPLHHSHSVTNNWQGEFPLDNEVSDGYATTAPTGEFPANGYGLHDITGNVWEWVSDWYHPNYYASSPSKNPIGVSMSDSLDPLEPGLAKRSIRGGSFLCSDNYCAGFRVSARMPADPGTATNHTGFRCARRSNMMEKFSRRSI